MSGRWRNRWGTAAAATMAMVVVLWITAGEAVAQEGASIEWGDERQRLEDKSREELEEEGFEFEDIFEERERAYATLFAMTAGVVVPGAGHWQLEDSRTGLSLVALDLSALALITAGTVLSLKPTERAVIDDRRYELWFGGMGLLGTSWLIDIFGTAYRDDLGIPSSTRRQAGLGVEARYEFVRPRDLTLRHMWTTEAQFRSRSLEGELGTSQEFGWGMSDYFVSGRWFPQVSRDGQTRLGLGVSGRMARYRIDLPFQRADGAVHAGGDLNLGRLVSHLEEMHLGLRIGVGMRGQRDQDQEVWSNWREEAWLVPMRLELALNVTDPLRLTVGFERGHRDWLEPQASRVGHPTVEVRYRSTERVDLHFQSYFGQGTGLGAGVRFWFGEP